MNRMVLLLMLLPVITLSLPSELIQSELGVIEGCVTDRETGKPLPLVNILVKGSLMGTVTDKDGRYSVDNVPPGNYAILTTMMGYRAVTKNVIVKSGEVSVVDFKLGVAPIELGGIVVTGTRTDAYLADVPVRVTVVPIEEIERGNNQTAADAVAWLTAVNIEGSGYSRAVVSLQGLPAKYTLIMVDGQRIMGGHGDDIDLSQIPIDMIEKIEILKGPCSALYGSDALGGVINVITKSVPLRLCGDGSVSYGSNNTQIYRLNHGLKFGDFGYIVTGSRSKTDGLKEYDGYTANNVFARVDYGKDTRIIASTGYYWEDRIFLDMKEKKLNSRIEGSHRLDDISSIKIKGYWTQYNHSLLSHGEPSTAKELILRAEAQYDRQVFTNNLLTFGFDYSYNKRESDIIDGSENIKSLFVQDQIEWFDNFSLILGLRTDVHRDWGIQYNPKLNIMYKQSDKLNIRASVGRGFKAPTLSQLHMFWYHRFGGGFWISGNPDLKPESSIGYNLDLEIVPTTPIWCNLSIFWNDVKDMMVIEHVGTYGDKALFTYVNSEEVNTKGIEAETKVSLLKYIRVTAGYTYTMAKNVQTGNELTYTPQHKLIGNLGFHSEEIGLTADLRGQYIGERYIDINNTTKLDGYYVLHFKAGQTIFRYLKLSFAVDNILDFKYEEMGQMEGRSFLGSIGVSF